MRQSLWSGSPPESFRAFSIPRLLNLTASARTVTGGEVLHNGIVLPEAWPPQVECEDIQARKPIPDPPYLIHPPAVMPIDVGRQHRIHDFHGRHSLGAGAVGAGAKDSLKS